jgi:hypothetical protein
VCPNGIAEPNTLEQGELFVIEPRCARNGASVTIASLLDHHISQERFRAIQQGLAYST